ncbi:MAG: hypothetical protein JKY02_01795, partial [Flavobacteriaceae bacterium]|nr:hypothetical protein [Flavobacteriaceae bacterium]
MKNYALKMALIFFGLSLIFACEPGIVINDTTPSDFGYILYVDSTANKNAPSLQSFAHGVSGEDWLLFAGRTNVINDDGGLHDISGNYTNTSFLPTTFNDSIFVYNVSTDQRKGISLSQMKAILKNNNFPENLKALKGFEHVFRNSNPLVKQDGEFLYVVGGYGPEFYTPAKPKKGKSPKYNFITYNHVAKIHVPSLISLVYGNYENVDKGKLFSFGRDNSLISTGGELHKAGNKFYVVMGHCFGNNCTPFQKYVDAAYPFKVAPYKDSIHSLKVSVGTAITDVSDPTNPIADNISAFRRRDGPITPAIYKSPVSGKIQEGIAVYSGVFKPGSDTDLQAWNDALYIHPNWANSESKLFTYDKDFNLKNYNAYACPSFVVYDSIGEVSQTFLLGGIGDGKPAPNGNLTGFTNTAVRIETNIAIYPLRSTHELINPGNLYSKDSDNATPPFYGTEAVLFSNSALPVVKASSINLKTNR